MAQTMFLKISVAFLCKAFVAQLHWQLHAIHQSTPWKMQKAASYFITKNMQKKLK